MYLYFYLDYQKCKTDEKRKVDKASGEGGLVVSVWKSGLWHRPYNYKRTVWEERFARKWNS